MLFNFFCFLEGLYSLLVSLNNKKIASDIRGGKLKTQRNKGASY